MMKGLILDLCFYILGGTLAGLIALNVYHPGVFASVLAGALLFVTAPLLAPLPGWNSTPLS